MAKKTPKNKDPQQFEDKPVVKKQFHLEFLNAAQKMAWGAFDQHDVLFLLGPPGCGKALTLNSKLFTRNGSIQMRDVKIGDEIANPDGNFSKVTGVYPQGKKQICRVHFSDNTYVDCCEEHLWEIKHANGWTKVVNTKYLESNCRDNGGKRILSIPCTKAVNFNRKDYTIDPYMMGIFLAEGCFTGPNVCFSASEDEITNKVSSMLNEEYVIKTQRKNDSVDHRIVKKQRSGKANVYKDTLRTMNLWNKFSWEKFIPSEYQYGSVDQRVALLQGLMDGDGTVAKNGGISYSTTSYQLAQDFCQLIYSLGGITRIIAKEGSLKEDGTRHRISYRCQVNLPNEIKIFFLQRKNDRRKMRSKYFPKKYIDRVERLGLEEMQCISVDHPRRLYLTDNYIPTHNTFLACAFAVSEILAKRRRKIVLTRPIVEAGESLGYLPGDMSEKVGPYMTPMFDCLDTILGPEGPQRDNVNRAIEVAPIAFMRGRTFQNSICIFDEAQNATKMQLKLFMTRFGTNSKIIITGDPQQSDIRDPALMKVVKKLEGVSGIGVIHFKANAIVRHPLIASIIEKLEEQE